MEINASPAEAPLLAADFTKIVFYHQSAERCSPLLWKKYWIFSLYCKYPYIYQRFVDDFCYKFDGIIMLIGINFNVYNDLACY